MNKYIEATRMNTHQTHFEDLVTFGTEGFDELNSKIEAFLADNQDSAGRLNTTTKIDGAPAVVCWSKFDGYPDNSIQLKSFVGGAAKALSTPEQIDERYPDPGMGNKLKFALELAHYIPEGEAWQGDVLFTAEDLEERNIHGKDYLTFQPNTIIYSIPHESPSYEKIVNADFGIAFHTIYKDAGEGKKTQSFKVDPNRIGAPENYYIMSVDLAKGTGDNSAQLNQIETKYSQELSQYYADLTTDPAYNAICENEGFMAFWNTFENKNIADKRSVTLNVASFIEDLWEYIDNKTATAFNKKYDSLKTEKGKINAKAKYESEIAELSDLVQTNKDTLIKMAKALNCAAEIKMIMWEMFRTRKADYDTFFQSKSQGYIPAEMEGVAMSDSEGNIVKVVDRTTFSANNRSDDIISGFDHKNMAKVAESLFKAILREAKREYQKVYVKTLKNDSALCKFFLKNIQGKDKEDAVMIKNSGEICISKNSPLLNDTSIFPELAAGEARFVFDDKKYSIHISGNPSGFYGPFDMDNYEKSENANGAIAINSQELLFAGVIQQILDNNRNIKFEPKRLIDEENNYIGDDGILELEKVLNCKIPEGVITVLPSKNWPWETFTKVLDESFKDILPKLGTVDRVIRCDTEPEGGISKKFVTDLFNAASGSGADKDTYAPADLYLIDSSKVGEISKRLLSARKTPEDFIEFTNSCFEQGILVPISLKKGDGHWTYVKGGLPPSYEITSFDDFISFDFTSTGNTNFFIKKDSINKMVNTSQDMDALLEFRTRGAANPWQCQAKFEKAKAYAGSLKQCYQAIFSDKEKAVKPTNENFRELFKDSAEALWKDLEYFKITGKVTVDGKKPKNKDEFLDLFFKESESTNSIQSRIGGVKVLKAMCNSIKNGMGSDIVTLIRRTFKVEGCQNLIKIS